MIVEMGGKIGLDGWGAVDTTRKNKNAINGALIVSSAKSARNGLRVLFVLPFLSQNKEDPTNEEGRKTK